MGRSSSIAVDASDIKAAARIAKKIVLSLGLDTKPYSASQLSLLHKHVGG